MVTQLVKEIEQGRRLKRTDSLDVLLEADLLEICSGANELRAFFCGNQGELCTIINGRSGKCGEDCKFCAQSCHHTTDISSHVFLKTEEIVKDCKKQEIQGVHRYSIVTAGRTLGEEDLEKVCNAYERLSKECGVSLCASHGLLDTEAFQRLKSSGVLRYHANIETSERNFPNICTSHSYKDKIDTIKKAKRAGLEICSGGIVGMGETWEDRLDMAAELAELQVDSIPLNVLVPIKGTPLEQCEPLMEEEILRIVAIFRFLNPKAQIRLAAGRILMKDSGKRAFLSGANAAITGDMLTTSGNNTKQDYQMFQDIGFVR